MDDNKSSVPFIVYESATSKGERNVKRLVSLIVIVVILWFFTIVGFTWYITLPIESTTTESQEVTDIENSDVSQSIN